MCPVKALATMRHASSIATKTARVQTQPARLFRYTAPLEAARSITSLWPRNALIDNDRITPAIFPADQTIAYCKFNGSCKFRNPPPPETDDAPVSSDVPPHLSQAWIAQSTGDGMPNATGKESYIYDDCEHGRYTENCMRGHIW